MRYIKISILFLFLFSYGPAALAENVDPGVSGFYDASGDSTLTPEAAKKLKNLDQLPLTFEEQPDRSGFLARGSGFGLSIKPLKSILTLKRKAENTSGSTAKGNKATPAVYMTSRVGMKLVGANSSARGSGIDTAITRTNYLIGNDPSNWRTDVPNYLKVKYEEVYPGIDLVYYGKRSALEYDFVVKPGADYRAIQLAFQGVDRISLDEKGDLNLKIGSAGISQKAPVIYQIVDGERTAVDGRYVLEEDRVRFKVAHYDRSKTLIIDPVVTVPYATWLGSSGFDEGIAIALKNNGELYVAGNSSSNTSGNTPGAFDETQNGSIDAFVTRISPKGDAIVTDTWIGGSQIDQVRSMKIDSAGRTFLTGTTFSPNFPTTPGALQTTLNGSSDAFFTVLNAAGTGLDGSSYLGGSGAETGHGLALIGASSIAVVGETSSTDFPVSENQNQSGGLDAFLATFDTRGKSSLRKTFGGNGTDVAYGVDTSAGFIYTSGHTSSTDFLATVGAYQSPVLGGQDAFVAKFSSGGELIYRALLGGSSMEKFVKITVDDSGAAYIAGQTASNNFPTTANAFDTGFNGGDDHFVAKLEPDGSNLVFSTFVGGSGSESTVGNIFLDPSRSVYVVSSTTSVNFPLQLHLNNFFSGTDGVFYQLDSNGENLVFSTYLSGNGTDRVHDGLVRGNSAVVVGYSNSTGNDGGINALQPNYAGGGDAFITQYSTGSEPPPQPGPPEPPKTVFIKELPFFILAPGKYVLLENLHHTCIGSSAITIFASNVILDLNGRVLDGNGLGDCNGINIGNHSNVRIIGNLPDESEDFSLGTIKNFSGVGIISLADSSRNISVNGVGIFTSGQRGILLKGKNHVVGNSIITGNQGGGILVEDNAQIFDNDVVDNTGHGIDARFSGFIFANTVNGNTGTGIIGESGGTYTFNNVRDNGGNPGGGGEGIVANGLSTVKDNAVSNNQLSGIKVAQGSTGSVIRFNNVSKNNLANSPLHAGIVVGGGVLVSNNTASGNLGGNFREQCCSSTPNIVKDNTGF